MSDTENTSTQETEAQAASVGEEAPKQEPEAREETPAPQGMSFHAKNYFICELAKAFNMGSDNADKLQEVVETLAQGNVAALVLASEASDENYSFTVGAFDHEGESVINLGFGQIQAIMAGLTNLAPAIQRSVEIDFTTPFSRWLEYDLITDPDPLEDGSAELDVNAVRPVTTDTMAGLINDPIYYRKQITIQGDRVTVLVKKAPSGKNQRHLFLYKTLIQNAPDGQNENPSEDTPAE